MTLFEAYDATLTLLFWALLLALVVLPLLAHGAREERAPHRRAETRRHPSAEPPSALTGEVVTDGA